MTGVPLQPSRQNPVLEAMSRKAERTSETQKLLADLVQMRNDRDRWRDEARKAQGLLRKMGHRVLREQTPRTVGEAVNAFLSTDRAKPGGTGATGQWRDILRYWLDRFAKEVGETKDVYTIEADVVIRHVSALRGPDHKPDTLKRLALNLCKFLFWSTNGVFNAFEARQWVKANCVSQGKEWWCRTLG